MSEGPGIASHARAATAAARRLIRRLGLDDAGAHVLHSSNNTIVHFPACGLVAKVGTSPDAPETLARELALGLHLAARGAEIAAPALRVAPGSHHDAGLEITLWEYVPHDADPELDEDERPALSQRARHACGAALDRLRDVLPRPARGRPGLPGRGRLPPRRRRSRIARARGADAAHQRRHRVLVRPRPAPASTRGGRVPPISPRAGTTARRGCPTGRRRAASRPGRPRSAAAGAEASTDRARSRSR
jgi:hypothetical protein